MTDKISLKDMKFPKGCPKIEFYRKPEYYEMTISLFTKCNLNCEFCSQEHATDLDPRNLDQLITDSIDRFREDYEKYSDTLKKIEVRFWGGEMYSDNIPDEYFYIYIEFLEELQRRIFEEFPNIRVELITTTNGVLTKRHRLTLFLRKVGILRISVSYDYIGRYKTEKQKQTALETIKFLSQAGFDVNLGIILTKRAINYVLQNPNEFTDLIPVWLAKTINFNFYIPNKGWEVDLPSDDDLFAMYKFCIDNRIFGVKTIFYLFETYMTRKPLAKECECKFLPNIFEHGTSKNCIQCFSNLGNKLFYGEFSDEITEENVSDVKASLGMFKRGCLACEHNEYCQMPCWSSVIFEHFKPTACPLKRAYEYITEEDLIPYKTWRKEDNGFNNW